MNELLSRVYETNYSYIDNRGCARPSFLFHMMQDAATVHAEQLHFSAKALEVLWVLTSVSVFLDRPLLPYERVRCDTWCPGVRGVRWRRRFAFFVENEKVGEAISLWVTLNPQTHRILRPSALPKNHVVFYRTEESPLPLPPKLSCNNARLQDTYTIRYSDLDVNHHINNARIVDLLSDTLALQERTDFLSMLQINYTAETLYGETLSLLRGTTENQTHYVRGEAQGTTRFEAQAIFSSNGKEA